MCKNAYNSIVCNGEKTQYNATTIEDIGYSYREILYSNSNNWSETWISKPNVKPKITYSNYINESTFTEYKNLQN